MMETEPIISVVIPMHNEAESIARCLEALIAQNLMPLEVIVVDNNSIDKCAEIVLRYASQFPELRLKLTTESRPGPAAARNKGIKVARGDILAFTDADCIVDKHWVRNIANAFIEDESLDAIGGIERPFSEHSTLIHRVVSATWLPPIGHLQTRTIKNKDEWLDGVFISTFNCAIRRTYLEDIDGFDEGFYPCGEDMDLWFRLLERGAKIVAWYPKIIVEHHQALSMRALLRKMFFYGEALAHLAAHHFRGRFFILSRWFGTTPVTQIRITGIIWNQTISSLFVLFVFLVIGSLSWILIIPVLVLFLAILVWKIRDSIIRKGFSVTLAELPLAVVIYSLRTIAREVGLFYGSVKHRVLCI